MDPTPSQSDPLAAARRGSRPALPRRFYAKADIADEAGLAALLLDGKRARTPAGNPLVTPAGWAETLVAEWNAQAEFIDPASMPVTRLANTAIDGVSPRLAEVRAATLAYAGADLICYRAGEPAGLMAHQAAAWDPVLAWAEKRFGGRFILSEGITHVVQPPAALAALAAEMEGYNEPFRLAGLNLATTLTGSVLIALALAEAAVATDQAWAAAHVDDDWNISQWGEDAEAGIRRGRRLADFKAAALALRRP